MCFFCKKTDAARIHQRNQIKISDGNNKNIDEQLIISEYNSCRSAILKNIEIMEKFELVTAAAVIGMSAFLFSHDKSSIPNISFFLPLIISIFGYLKYLSIDSVIGFYNNFLIETEKYFPNIINLTTNFRDCKHDRIFNLGFIHFIFWFLLFIFSVFVILFRIHVCL